MGMYAKYPKHQDRTFKPNKELSEGDEIKEVDHTLIAIHTPGHASNHICFFLEEEKMLFTGDHIICLLYTSPSPRDTAISRMPSSA